MELAHPSGENPGSATELFTLSESFMSLQQFSDYFLASLWHGVSKLGQTYDHRV